jgi:hypothetical protein
MCSESKVSNLFFPELFGNRSAPVFILRSIGCNMSGIVGLFVEKQEELSYATGIPCPRFRMCSCMCKNITPS